MTKKLLILADRPLWYSEALLTQLQSSRVDIGVTARLHQSKDECDRLIMQLITDTHRGVVGDPDAVVSCYGCGSNLLEDDRYHSVLSLHATEIFRPELVNAIPCFNLHPGYLPYGRGWHPVTFARRYGFKAGATLHVMDEGIDTGPIIEQIEVPYSYEDTCAEIYGKVHTAEVQLLRKWIKSFVEGPEAAGCAVPQPEGNWPTFTKKQYEELCRIPVGSWFQAGMLVSRLAALTHSERNSHAVLEDVRGQRWRVGVFMERIEDDPECGTDDVPVQLCQDGADKSDH